MTIRPICNLCGREVEKIWFYPYDGDGPLVASAECCGRWKTVKLNLIRNGEADVRTTQEFE